MPLITRKSDEICNENKLESVDVNFSLFIFHSQPKTTKSVAQVYKFFKYPPMGICNLAYVYDLVMKSCNEAFIFL